MTELEARGDFSREGPGADLRRKRESTLQKGKDVPCRGNSGPEGLEVGPWIGRRVTGCGTRAGVRDPSAESSEKQARH